MHQQFTPNVGNRQEAVKVTWWPPSCKHHRRWIHSHSYFGGAPHDNARDMETKSMEYQKQVEEVWRMTERLHHENKSPSCLSEHGHLSSLNNHQALSKGRSLWGGDIIKQSMQSSVMQAPSDGSGKSCLLFGLLDGWLVGPGEKASAGLAPSSIRSRNS